MIWRRSEKSPRAAYARDLAYIHDAGFGGHAEAVAPWFVALLRANGFQRGLVVDLGCGSGVLARRLIDVGYDVLGIDQSEALLRIARRRTPEATFRRGSFVSSRLPPCVGVTAIGEVLNYAIDRGNDPAATRRVFARVRRALAPGGVFAFDVAGPGRAPGGAARNFALGDDWAVMSQSRERGRRLTREITSFRRVGATYRRSFEVHELLLRDPGRVEKWLRAAGFSDVTQRVRVGSFRLPGLTTFVATWGEPEEPTSSHRRSHLSASQRSA